MFRILEIMFSSHSKYDVNLRAICIIGKQDKVLIIINDKNNLKLGFLKY